MSIFKAIKKFLADEDGPTGVEYAVMLALICLAVMSTVIILGSATGDSFQTSSDEIDAAINGS